MKRTFVAREKGLTPFISIQNHYNIIYREDERDLTQLIEEEGMSMTPFSPLAAGRVCRMWTDENSQRAKEDKISRIKYDGERDIDLPIVKRIKEVADKMKVTMAQVSMAWLLAQKNVASPVFGCTKVKQLEDLCESVKIKLSPEDIKYLSELYQPHPNMGAMPKGAGAFYTSNKKDEKK